MATVKVQGYRLEISYPNSVEKPKVFHIQYSDRADQIARGFIHSGYQVTVVEEQMTIEVSEESMDYQRYIHEEFYRLQQQHGKGVLVNNAPQGANSAY